MMSFLRLEFRLYLLEGKKKDLCLFFFVCKIGLRMAIFHAANGSVHSNVLCFIDRERGGAPTMHSIFAYVGFPFCPIPTIYAYVYSPPIPPASRKFKTVRGTPLLFLIPTDH